MFRYFGIRFTFILKFILDITVLVPKVFTQALYPSSNTSLIIEWTIGRSAEREGDKALSSPPVQPKILIRGCYVRVCVCMGRGHVNRRYSVTACFDGNKRVVSGSEDGSIYIWDINNSKSVVQKLQGHNGNEIGRGLDWGLRSLNANIVSRKHYIYIYIYPDKLLLLDGVPFLASG